MSTSISVRVWLWWATRGFILTLYWAYYHFSNIVVLVCCRIPSACIRRLKSTGQALGSVFIGSNIVSERAYHQYVLPIGIWYAGKVLRTKFLSQIN